jgi:hypothetical protein
MNARLQITYACRTALVKPWGFEMECDYEYEPGESPCYDVDACPGPGYPANASLVACRVAGVDITDMLDVCQREFIEETILEQLED